MSGLARHAARAARRAASPRCSCHGGGGPGLDAARGGRAHAGHGRAQPRHHRRRAASSGRRSPRARELLAGGEARCHDGACRSGPRARPVLRRASSRCALQPRRCGRCAPSSRRSEAASATAAAGAAVRRRPCRPGAGARAGAAAAARALDRRPRRTPSRTGDSAGHRGGASAIGRWRRSSAAPAGAAFLVLTHSHALDFEICAAALRRGDFAYLGLIGSATKRAQFERGFRELGIAQEQIDRLVCPIGGGDGPRQAAGGDRGAGRGRAARRRLRRMRDWPQDERRDGGEAA